MSECFYPHAFCLLFYDIVSTKFLALLAVIMSFIYKKKKRQNETNLNNKMEDRITGTG